jgi:hypothetical protein
MPKAGPFFHAREVVVATLARLCQFAREHENQARTNCDELRAEQWNDVLDQLLDRRFGMITA